jgi:hypothetical protein
MLEPLKRHIQRNQTKQQWTEGSFSNENVRISADNDAKSVAVESSSILLRYAVDTVFSGRQ